MTKIIEDLGYGQPLHPNPLGKGYVQSREYKNWLEEAFAVFPSRRETSEYNIVKN
jgi:hypothetical protein